MEKRFVGFLFLAFAILMANALISAWLRGPQPDPKIAQGDPRADGAAPNAKQPDAKQPIPKEGRPPEPTHDEPPGDEPVVAPPAGEPPAPDPEKKPEQKVENEWLTLGSLDPASPYRMLVTFTNQGAAIHRLELSSPRFRSLDDRSGYLGHLSLEPAADGARVRVVGAGTPADEAGLKVGDVIVAVNEQSVADSEDLRRLLLKTKPRQQVMLSIARDGKNSVPMPVTLGRRPLELMRPEIENIWAREQMLSKALEAPKGFQDPPSMLLTLQQVGEESIDEDAAELPGISLIKANWEIVEKTATVAAFRRRLPAQGVEIIKRYRLATVPEEEHDDRDYPAYHLMLEIELRNVAGVDQTLAYRLDGPTGLPTEGWWYSSKISRQWGSVGIRDVVARFYEKSPEMFGCATIVTDGVDAMRGESLMYMGVDAKYFSAVLIPQKEIITDIWLDESDAVRLAPEPTSDTNKQLVNVTCRLLSEPKKFEPNESLKHTYQLFAGPKAPDLLAKYHQPTDDEYSLSTLIYYGYAIWAVFAKLMLGILHVLYAVVRNYGIAIILLTVLVRGAMFPLSRKQALNMIKMQELQPEMKRIMEKYKKDLEKRSKAMQDLYRKHNYNPMGGCLVMVLQLPVFIGLYRGLMIDIELRQAPLLGDSIRWCSDLSAPDRLFDWSAFMPDFINSGVGIFGLGPYFNLLPVLTVVLFLAQQKMFMPPPADEQAAMQQKIMKYMMIFIGLMFYKVASGLCLYFIVSSLWGICERKVLPKAQPATALSPSDDEKPAKREPKPAAGNNGAGGKKKGQKQRRK